MPPVIQDFIRGALKIDGFIDDKCFSSWQEFLEELPKLLAVDLPASLASIIVSQEQPSEDDRGRLWARQDSNGGFIGLYAFQQGQWRPFYNFAPGQVIWMHGDSTKIPEGFLLIEQGDPLLSQAVVGALTGQYVRGLGDNFAYFAVRFQGF